MKSICPYKDMNTHRIFVRVKSWKHPNVYHQVNGWTNCVIHPYGGMLFSNKKEFQNNYTEWKKTEYISYDFIIWGSRKCTNLSWLQTDGCLVMGAWRNLGIIDILSWLWGCFMYIHVRFTNSNNLNVCRLILSSIKLWKKGCRKVENKRLEEDNANSIRRQLAEDKAAWSLGNISILHLYPVKHSLEIGTEKNYRKLQLSTKKKRPSH